MGEDLSVELVAEAMVALLQACHGKRSLKPLDLTKAMIEKFGEDQCDRKTCNLALRQLMDSGRCVYTYFGGSYVEIPHEEGAAGGS